MTAVMAFLKMVPIWAYAAFFAVLLIVGQHYRIASVTSQRDALSEDLAVSAARVESLKNTAKLQRELNSETAATAAEYQVSVNEIQNRNEALANQLARDPGRLHVNATCVVSSAGKPGSDAGSADAGSARLTADAQRNYLRLTAGIELQREQVKALQSRIRQLEGKCKIGG